MNSSVALRSRLVWRSVPRDAALLARAFSAALSLIALAAIAAFLVAAVFRLGYPFPLQQTEAASLREVQRILAGQPLYVAPTLQHVPMIYGPIYFYLSAAVAALVGLSYLPLRLVSLLASLGSLGLLAWLIWRETSSRAAALAGAGLLAASYPLNETVLDQGRVDALFAFFLLAALSLARLRTSWRWLAASGVLLGLAALTKIPLGAAPVGLALAVYLAITLRGRAAAFVLGAAITVALGLLLLRLQSGPWPSWYLWDLPRQHAVNDHGDLLGRFWFIDILPRFTFSLVLGPLFILLRLGSGDRGPLLFYPLVGASLIGVAWAARSNSGGATNVLLPMHILLALSFGLGLYAVGRGLGAGSVGSGGLGSGGPGPGRLLGLQAYVVGLCLLQFGLLAYNPRLLVPYRSEEWAAERLSTTLASLSGPLLAPDLDAYLRTSDKGEQPHLGAVDELTGGYGGRTTPEGQQWRADLNAALAARRFSHVVVNDPCCDLKDALARNGYTDAGPLFPPGDDYWLWSSSRTPQNLEVFIPPPD